jgi:hypothetical protein
MSSRIVAEDRFDLRLQSVTPRVDAPLRLLSGQPPLRLEVREELRERVLRLATHHVIPTRRHRLHLRRRLLRLRGRDLLVRRTQILDAARQLRLEVRVAHRELEFIEVDRGANVLRAFRSRISFNASDHRPAVRWDWSSTAFGSVR